MDNIYYDDLYSKIIEYQGEEYALSIEEEQQIQKDLLRLSSKKDLNDDDEYCFDCIVTILIIVNHTEILKDYHFQPKFKDIFDEVKKDFRG